MASFQGTSIRGFPSTARLIEVNARWNTGLPTIQSWIADAADRGRPMPSAADMPAKALVRRDKRPVTLQADDIVCVSCVRNEVLRLPFFLEYHRKLGVDRFFLIDNASTDETLGYLLGQPDVHVYHTEASYAESRCGVAWLNELLVTHAKGHWALTLDADELLVYPSCERAGLPLLTRYLDVTGAGSLHAVMLDMYSDRPIGETLYRSGSNFLDVCRYYDSDNYHELDARGLPRRGGARHRLFWDGKNNPKPSPFLEKFPLAKWGDGIFYEASTHIIRGCRPAAMTGVLLHFKLFSDFGGLAKREAARGEHWDAAAQYKAYWKVLSSAENLMAFHQNSRHYEDSAQLVYDGLMRADAGWTEFLDMLDISTPREKAADSS